MIQEPTEMWKRLYNQGNAFQSGSHHRRLSKNPTIRMPQDGTKAKTWVSTLARGKTEKSEDLISDRLVRETPKEKEVG